MAWVGHVENQTAPLFGFHIPFAQLLPSVWGLPLVTVIAKSASTILRPIRTPTTSGGRKICLLYLVEITVTYSANFPTRMRTSRSVIPAHQERL